MLSTFKKQTIYIVLLLIQLLFHSNNVALVSADAGCECGSATYTNTVPQNAGGQRNIDSGELLCITGTTNFTENIARLEGEICVEPTATYEVNQNFQYYSGTITNYGAMTFNTSTNMSDSAILTNYGQITATQNASFNINGNALIDNKEDANFVLDAGLTLGDTATIQNAGSFIMTSHVNIHSTANINNSGLISAKDNVALTGNITNTGEFYMLGTLNINNGANLTNSCRMISSDGFVNGAEIVNDGLIYEIPSGTPLEDGNTTSSSDTFQNNGTWVNGADAIVYGVDFSSSGAISGGGSFYFEDFTRLNGGSFGDDADTDIINFYDANMACSGAGDGPNGEFDDAPSWMTIEETTCSAMAKPSLSHFPEGCSFASLNLIVTVGTAAGECALSDEISLPGPEDAFYCYTLENLSGMDITVTDLIDDKVDLSQFDLGLPVTLSAIDETTLAVDSYSIVLAATVVIEDVVNSAIATGADELGAPLLAGDTAIVDLATSAPTSVTLSSTDVNKDDGRNVWLVGLVGLLILLMGLLVGRQRLIIR